MDPLEARKIIEALLFVSDQPISMNAFRSILGESLKDDEIKTLVEEIAADYEKRNGAIQLRFIAGGWQFATKKEYSAWIKKFYRGRTTMRLSKSALETLAIIAYKQPITRAEIEELRGVEVFGVLDTLMERKLVRIVGRKEVIGRPLIYGTSNEFLHHFGLSHMSELPSLDEFAKEAADVSESSETSSAQELPFQNSDETLNPNENEQIAPESIQEK